MAYSVVFSGDAEKDLRGIHRYIAIDLLMPESAMRLVSRIESAALSLSEMPFRFPQYRDRHGRARDLRVMSAENYCIFYTVDDVQKVVTIVAVIHGARNLRDLFGDS